jgi:hypothetical protein
MQPTRPDNSERNTDMRLLLFLLLHKEQSYGAERAGAARVEKNQESLF